jgi:glycerol kinase
MDTTHVMALDAGTSSVRAIVFNHDGEIVSIARRDFTQIYPRPGWVEHDANEIWESQRLVMHEALADAGIAAGELAAIGITNQRETLVVWDAETGEPVMNAIVWQDGRTADYCDELKRQGLEAHVRDTTGLIVDAYFSGTKLKWLLDNVGDARDRAERGELKFGTIDTWLIWNLTDGAAHVTDYSNASRTLLFDIHALDWDDTMLEVLGVPRAMLPEVRPSSEVYGRTGERAGLDAAVPVASAIGDQQGALFGQACFESGQAKATYGTGGSLVMNTGDTPFTSENGLLTTIAWGIGGQVEYAIEGLLFVVGASVQWLRDQLQIINDPAETEDAARQVQSTDGVYLIPAFVGLGAPYWDQHARAAIVGLTSGSNRNHIIRAALEAIAYQFRDVQLCMEKDCGIQNRDLRVDGGAVGNDFLMQFQADVLGVPVLRPRIVESTARGAAFLAGLATGFWSDKGELRDTFVLEQRFEPQIDDAERDRLYDGWRDAVSRALEKEKLMS